MTTAATRSRVRLLTAFVIGFVTLTLEIAYTRVISFKLFYYYTYFVIGLALLGLGAASATVALSRRLRSMDTVVLIRFVGPAAGIFGSSATSPRRGCRRTSTSSGPGPPPTRSASCCACSCCRRPSPPSSSPPD